MRVACNICEDIAGLSYLMVGMPECGTYSRGMSSMPEGACGELRRIYVLDANEVIFGCRAGVTDALRVMDKEGARAILIIATCVTDLIGEDLEGLINEVQPELNARLTYVTLGQFKNFGGASGTWKTAEALGALMKPHVAQPAVKSPVSQPVSPLPPASQPPASQSATARLPEAQPSAISPALQPATPSPATGGSGGGCANALLIEAWHNKNDTVKFPLIVGALEKKGVRIRRLSPGANLDDFLDAPDAAMNLILNAVSQPLAAKMEAAFHTPYAPLHNSFSVAEVDAAYGAIADAFGFNWGGEFDDWRGLAASLESRARSELAGLKYAMLPGVDMPAALAVYLAGFGMEPIIVAIEDFHGEDSGYAKKLKTLGYDPYVCRMMNIDYDVEIVRKLKPDISFGALPDPIDGFLCAEYMGDFFGITGYERTAGILSRIFKLLETGDIGERIDLYGAAPV